MAVFEKNDFYKIWTMGYGFRHVLIVQKAQASKLKPHIWKHMDLWKKNEHFKYWKSPYSYYIVTILAKINSSLCNFWAGFLGGLLPIKPRYIMDLWFFSLYVPLKHLFTSSGGLKRAQNMPKISPKWDFYLLECFFKWI